MLFYTGYIQWGNFAFPLNANILNSFNTLTWDGYSYNGIPVISPWISFFGNFNNLSIIAFGGTLNLNVAIKFYILFTFFYMAYSFYLFTASISKYQFSRVSATIFILTNPISLQLIGQGDPFQFFVWGLYFLSLLFLFKSSKKEGGIRKVFLFLSISLLSLTVSIPQIFYLGTVLYIFFIFYFYLTTSKSIKLVSLFAPFKVTLMAISVLFLLSMPLLLTSFLGVYNLSPNSEIANPLSNFSFYSAHFINMLFINSYPSMPITNLLGSLNNYYITTIWIIAIDSFVIILLVSGFLFKDKKMILFSTLIILEALLGSGYYSPISGLNIYFYTHIFGYQVLNTSYYWEWLAISPIYAILLMQLIDHLSTNTKLFSGIIVISRFSIIKNNQCRTRKIRIIISPSSFKKIKISYKLFVLITLAILVILPLAGQGFYGPGNSGIHKDNVPNSYDSLVKKLDGFIGNTSTGVAYFPPSNYVYFGNNTNGVSQPLLTEPGFRSPGTPSYLSPPVISSDFSCYVYTQFYLNKTPFIAQLFSILGVKYFVTLNGVISASSMHIANNRNPTELMKYQKDVIPIFYNNNYTIYESTLNVNVAQSVKGFSIYSNNYNDLMYSADLGVNISKEAPLFTNDLSSSNFDFLLNNTNSLILCSQNSLTTLAIDKFTNSKNSINPLSNSNNYLSSPNEGWISSSDLETENISYIISDPYSFSITSSNIPKSYSFNVNETGNYNLWAEVLLNSVNSKIKFQINNKNSYVDQNLTNITTGSMQWVKIPFETNNVQNSLNISSLNGLNGIQKIVIIKQGKVKTEEKIITNIIHSRNIPLIYLSNSGLIQYANSGIFPDKVSLVNTQPKGTGQYEQSITLPSEFYRGKANNNFSNAQWQYANGTIIDSWMESFNSTSATWWIKVNGIPAESKLPIFLVFFPLNRDILNNRTTGESPLINPKYDNGRNVFIKFNSTGLIGNGNGKLYNTNVGFYFYTKFFNQTSVSGNQAFVGWNYNKGIYTPMFVARSNRSFSQPYYFINQSHYLPYHILNDRYYLFGTSLEGKDAKWYLNNVRIAETNSSKFVKFSETYIRPTGVNVSVKYSFMTSLPINDTFPTISYNYVNLSNVLLSLNQTNKQLSTDEIYNVINNPNGYEVKNINSNLTIVRYGYYSGMLETTKGFSIIPTMNGLNFILVSSKRDQNAVFISVDYSLLFFGLIIYGMTISAIIVYSVIIFKKEKHVLFLK